MGRVNAFTKGDFNFQLNVVSAFLIRKNEKRRYHAVIAIGTLLLDPILRTKNAGTMR